jgi:hypothetical protein
VPLFLRFGCAFLARFFAYTALPDYRVACFVTTQTEGMNKTVGIAERYLAENELHWGWLVFVREGAIPEDSYRDKKQELIQLLDTLP